LSEEDKLEDLLVIAKKEIKNRLFIGTGKFSSNRIMKEVLEKVKPDVVTVALRRVDTGVKSDNILDYIPKECLVMTNTSGARNAEEAIRIARLAKASGAGNWIKIEIIRDNKYLLPDNLEVLKATAILVKEGFVVLPYMSPDIAVARKLVEYGSSAVMPLGSPIGSNRGLRTEELVKIMIEEVNAPIIVDAGLGRPSDACRCMELGCAAVLINTAIAVSPDPVNFAEAFNKAVASGRQAFLSGIPAQSNAGQASSPLTGFLRE